MEVSKEKSKTMVNDENASISMDGTLREDLNTFKYLGATLKSDAASDNELRIRLGKYNFSCEIQPIQVTNQYCYTGAKLRP